MYSVGDKVKLNCFWRKSTTETDNYCIVEDRRLLMIVNSTKEGTRGILYYTDHWIVPDYMLIPERSLGNAIRNRRKSVS